MSVVVILGAGLFTFNQPDLATSGFFYNKMIYNRMSFEWRYESWANFIHNLVHPAAVILGLGLAGLTLLHYFRKSGWRRWAFVLLALLLGPGLMVNTVFKDNWGRARPTQIEQFGGKQVYTKPLLMANQCQRNCSFVAGDPSFGFWFHSFAYIARRRRRALFFSGLGLGAAYGVLRVGMGAHFLSDVFFAGVLIVGLTAALYGMIFGRRALALAWREWLGLIKRPA